MKRLFAVLLGFLAAAAAHADAGNPNVRAITAFVRLDRANFEKQIDEAMTVLNAARAEFTRRG